LYHDTALRKLFLLENYFTVGAFGQFVNNNANLSKEGSSPLLTFLHILYDLTKLFRQPFISCQTRLYSLRHTTHDTVIFHTELPQLPKIKITILYPVLITQI